MYNFEELIKSIADQEIQNRTKQQQEKNKLNEKVSKLFKEYMQNNLKIDLPFKILSAEEKVECIYIIGKIKNTEIEIVIDENGKVYNNFSERETLNKIVKSSKEYNEYFKQKVKNLKLDSSLPVLEIPLKFDR
jgi:hypothetical protein